MPGRRRRPLSSRAHRFLFRRRTSRGGSGGRLCGGATHTTADVVRAALSLVGLADGGMRTLSSAFYMVTAPSPGAIWLRCSPSPTARWCGTPSASWPKRQPSGRPPTGASSWRRAHCRVALVQYIWERGGSVGRPRSRGTGPDSARAPGLVVDGELQGDAALVVEASMPGSRLEAPVAGRANVLVFPSARCREHRL